MVLKVVRQLVVEKDRWVQVVGNIELDDTLTSLRDINGRVAGPVDEGKPRLVEWRIRVPSPEAVVKVRHVDEIEARIRRRSCLILALCVI
jgi:hypothetical protein